MRFVIELLLTHWAVHYAWQGVSSPQRSFDTSGKQTWSRFHSLYVSGNGLTPFGRGKTGLSPLKIIRFSIRSHRWKAKNLLYLKICEIFLSRNCLWAKFAKLSCCENISIPNSTCSYLCCYGEGMNISTKVVEEFQEFLTSRKYDYRIPPMTSYANISGKAVTL